MLRTAFSFLVLLFSIPLFATCDPTITLAVGRPNGTEAEPTVVYAKATSGCSVTAMRVYVDSKLIYEQHGQNTINARLVMGAGDHRVTIKAWNSAGAVTEDVRYITSTADPTEPLAGCEIGDLLGAYYSGDHIPYTAKSPAMMGMFARSESAPISSLRLYIDGVDRAQTWGTSGHCLPAALMSLKPGYHFINVQAWDAMGHIYLTGSIVQIIQ